jgi:transposase
MYIEKFKNNGIEYLRLVESVYTPDVKGGRKKVILSIGPLSKFDDGKPDYVGRLKESFKLGKPLIDSLKKYCDNAAQEDTGVHTVTVRRGDPLLIGHPKLYSQVLIERILQELGLIQFFSQYSSYNSISFDLTGFFRLLVYGRVLSPASKITTACQNDRYYDPVLEDGFYRYNIYDTLDFIYRYRTNIISKMNSHLVKSFGRTTNRIFYDCTNFFFEIDEPDGDMADEDGNIVKGIRKYGVCKEERHLPIVQMGMFIDEQGVPVSMEIFPGNTLDHLTVIDSLKTVDGLNCGRYIFVGDRGMYRGSNSAYIVNHNHGYIVSKSIEKTQSEERKWIFDNEGYTCPDPNFKYKSRTYKRTVKTSDGSTQELVEKVVVYWSRKFKDKQIAENKSFLDFLDKLKDSPNNFKITRAQSGSLRKYLKKECVNSCTGEILDSSKIKMMIDFDAVNKYRESFGYYQIVTSEIDMPDLEIIDKYQGLSRIEDQFRIMKGSLGARPVYVRSVEHIYAHLLVCMIALVVTRIIQNKIVRFQNLRTDRNWTMGLPADRLQAALNKWTVSLFFDHKYRFNDIDDPDLKLILDSFGINIIPDLYSKSDLKTIKTGIKVL